MAKNVLYIMDLGYWDYDLLKRIMKQSSFFVMRLKDGADVTILEFRCKGYKALEGHRMKLSELIDNGNLGGDTFDAVIQLGDIWKIRLVGLKHEGEWYFYVTNITDEEFTAQVIYYVYTLRWEVELLFKDLKSGINLRNITTRNENAIMLEIYVVLIRHLLVRMLMSEATKCKGVRLSVRKSIALVKLRLVDMVLPMLRGKVRAFQRKLKDLLARLLARCEPG
jgi:IS4 transposase